MLLLRGGGGDYGKITITIVSRIELGKRGE
jgi:hypothetical protein